MKPSKNFYQWDINQKFTECDGRFVDFIINEKVVYRVDIVNGECIIPDEFLQKSGYHTVYECMSDYTIQNHMFPVHPREKPPGYVYTPTEKLTFEGLVQKVNDTVADIIHRADTGEFDGYTPVKGKDYFTEAEKNELMESVSSGAIGEFREVVDSATAGFNKNSSAKTNDYNTNAETKTAEFDSNAAALQTEVDRLRGECDNLAAENRKQENRISALMKLNKGQTYDILPEEGESASRTAPSGAKYVSVDKVGGKSVVWNQLCNPDTFSPVNCTVSESSGIVTLTDCANVNRYQAGFIAVIKGHKYYQTVKIKSDGTNPVGFQNYLFLDINDKTNSAEFTRLSVIGTCTESGKALVQLYSPNYTDYQIVKNSLMLFDLTLLFGAGNEPTAEQFEAMFTAESYPYNPGQIISSRTATITAGAETITTGFPELRSALAAHDYIDMDGEKVHRKIKSTKIDGNTPIYSVRTDQDNCCRVVFTPETSPGIVISEEPTIPTNIISDKLATITHNNYWSADAYTGIEAYPGYASISMRLQDRTDLDTKEKVSAWLADNPTTVYYETESDELADVTIPEALTEWLPVEAGGTVTFQNADESKQLAVPNGVSWVRKLDEVE